MTGMPYHGKTTRQRRPRYAPTLRTGPQRLDGSDDLVFMSAHIPTPDPPRGSTRSSSPSSPLGKLVSTSTPSTSVSSPSPASTTASLGMRMCCHPASVQVKQPHEDKGGGKRYKQRTCSVGRAACKLYTPSRSPNVISPARRQAFSHHKLAYAEPGYAPTCATGGSLRNAVASADLITCCSLAADTSTQAT